MLQCQQTNRNHYSGINKMEKSVQPKSIDVSNSDQELSITWADGHVSQFSLFGLRKNCPCVECRGGHELMGRFEPELFRVEPTRTYSVTGAETVGNHALKISWDDGHNSGMYRWKLLRQMDEAVQKLDQK